MVRRRAKEAQGFEVVRCRVAFVVREAVVGIELVPFVEEPVARDLREDGSRGDRYGARVAFDERALLDQQIEAHRVDQEIVGRERELRDGLGHRLAAGLIDVPGVDAARIGLRDSPCERMFTNAACEGFAALGRELLRVIQADNAASGIEDDSGGDNGAEERTAARFIESGDAPPAALARFAFVAGRAKPPHWRAF